MQDIETILEKIAAETGKTIKEVKKMVEEKKEKFSGLLTEEGAAFMIAKELNVELEKQEYIPKNNTQAKVSEIIDGMNAIDLELKVLHVFSPKTFEKEKRKGKLCSLIVGDETGETRLTIWNETIKKLDGIERGDTIIARNCYVKSFQEKPQLSLSFNGDITLKKKGKDDKMVKIKDLAENMDDVSVKGKIASNYGMKTFQKENNEGKITAMELEDETGRARIAAWNETAEEASQLKQGQEIKIEGAYTKQGQEAIEIHLGWKARIIKQ